VNDADNQMSTRLDDHWK